MEETGGLLQRALQRLRGESAPSSVFIFNARLVDRDIDEPGALLIRDGKIADVYTGENLAAVRSALQSAKDEGINAVDAGGAALTPAFTDLHAHFREPGFPQKETIETGSAAAVAGGYTAAVLMANTNPAISSLAAAQAASQKAKDAGLIRAFQAVSLTENFDGKTTAHLASLSPSVVPVASEDGRDVASSAVMLEAMKACSAAGIIVSCHCEDASLAEKAASIRKQGGFSEAERLFRLSEDIATHRNLLLAEEARCRVHIAHVSTKAALDAVRRAKARRPGLVTCEATPHHLCLNDTLSTTPDAAVNPPLRPEEDRLALIEGLKDGTIDAIATDHAPHTMEDKDMCAPGFSGLQTAFSLCFTELVLKGVISLNRLSELMAAAPASILSLPRGLLKTGYEGDVALINLQSSFSVNPASHEWRSKGKNTPLAGRTLCGQVLFTWREGAMVYSRDSENNRVRV